MKKMKGIWFITLVCIFLGFFTVRAFDNQDSGIEIGEVASIQRIEVLLRQKNDLEERKNQLDMRLHEIETAIEALENGYAKNNLAAQDVQQQLRNARMFAGLLPMEGPGIEIILNDRKRDSILLSNPYLMNYYIVHDSDMLNVINELRGAGAEAIAVNGVRIMANSRISCGGPTINVGKTQRFAPPFIFHAIGDSEALIAAFSKDDSIYQDLTAWGLEFHIKKLNTIEIPRNLGETDYQFAKPVKEGER